MLDLRVTGPDHPDAVALTAEVQAFYTEVYGGADPTPTSVEQFSPPCGVYLVGYDDSARPVVSGAWRAVDDDPEGSGVLHEGDAEIKRMYVVPAARGRGHARTLLAELERTARAAGRLRMVLETGTEQPEAVGLYASSGYAAIPRFGPHQRDDRSLCFAKPLLPERPPR